MNSPANKKPKLSFWQIWNMSFGFLGIQFGFALQNANTSRIFELLGADIDDIPILWIAAPVTGLIVQPIIGHLSDKTWGKLGRRRPYFLVGAILASAALFFMTNSPTLWVAAGMLWIMDASINVSMEPFRAFVGDMLPPEQRTMGFAMQSFFIGTGAVIASALPWILSNYFGLDGGEGVTDNVVWSFYIGGAIFLLAVIWTIIKTKEYPPEELARYEAAEEAENMAEDPNSIAKYDPTPIPNAKFTQYSIIFLLVGLISTIGVFYSDGDKNLYILTVGLGVFGILQGIAGILAQNQDSKSGFLEVMSDLFKMPKTMKQLAVVQFFSWFALFSLWIYSTNAITATHYDMTLTQAEIETLQSSLEGHTIQHTDADKAESIGKKLEQSHGNAVEEGTSPISVDVAKFFLPSTDENHPKFEISEEITASLSRVKSEYDTGADWVGILFAYYNGFAALVAFLLPLLAKRINRRRTHLVAMVMGGAGLVSIYFISDPQMLIISMLGVGIAWASILSMPYAMLTNAIPAKKMGVFMGIFNFFIVIPQLTAATILGSIVGLFQDQSIYALIIGGAGMILAGILTLFVNDKG